MVYCNCIVNFDVACKQDIAGEDGEVRFARGRIYRCKTTDFKDFAVERYEGNPPFLKDSFIFYADQEDSRKFSDYFVPAERINCPIPLEFLSGESKIAIHDAVEKSIAEEYADGPMVSEAE